MKLVPKNKMVRKLEMLKNGGKPVKQITFTGIKTTNNRAYDPETIAYINSKLANIPMTQRAAILANIIEESGGNALASGPGGFYGILQWSPDRYALQSNDTQTELDNQIQYILDTYQNLNDKMSWTHGGTGSGYNSLKDAYKDFNSSDLQRANSGFTLGYVRPAGKKQSASNRYKVAQQVYQILNDYDKYLKSIKK